MLILVKKHAFLLPNIIGDSGRINLSGANPQKNGALEQYRHSTGNAASTNPLTNCAIKFNASWSNSLYGAASSVQPKSLSCIYLIKT